MVEGVVHLATKEILGRTKKIALPQFDEFKRFVFEFDEILFEENVGKRFKADCVAIKGNHQLIIEIVDKGKVSRKKRQYYCDNKLNSIEIIYHLPKNLKEGTSYIDDFVENKLEHYIHTLRDSIDIKYEDDIPYDDWYYNTAPMENICHIMDKEWIVNNKYGIYNEPEPLKKTSKDTGWRFSKNGRYWTPDLRTKKGKGIIKEQEEHLVYMKEQWELARNGMYRLDEPRRPKWGVKKNKESYDY